MARVITFVPTTTEQQVSLSVIRDQKTRLNVDGTNYNLKLTIGNSAGGEPIIELPNLGGFFDLSPAKLITLKEGQSYRINIWDFADPTDPFRIATGSLDIGSSIAAFGVTYATQFLQGATSVVALTQPEYNALSPEDKFLPGVLYVIVGE